MVFSAPEITTVSKPKRNPASADVSDQKKMRAFISRACAIRASTQYRVPSPEHHAQTELELGTGYWVLGTAFRQRISLLPPVPDTAVHRNYIRVTHLLQVV